MFEAFEASKDMASVHDFEVVWQHVIGAASAGAFALARALDHGGEDFEPVETWKLASVLPHFLILTLGIGEASGLRRLPRLWRFAHAAQLDDPGGQKQDKTAHMILKAEHVGHRLSDHPALHMRAETHFLSELLGDVFLNVLTSCSSSFAVRAGCDHLCLTTRFGSAFAMGRAQGCLLVLLVFPRTRFNVAALSPFYVKLRLTRTKRNEPGRVFGVALGIIDKAINIAAQTKSHIKGLRGKRLWLIVLVMHGDKYGVGSEALDKFLGVRKL